MANVHANGIRIEYDTFGDRSARPLLLVMGLGAQMIAWRREFCEQLADAGHFVVRFDNRDVGLSEKFDAHGVPDIVAMMMKSMAGESVTAPYTLDDMAEDSFGLLDTLDIGDAHVCGASLGGMIAQAMAIKAPGRVKSLTSIMSTTGNRELPPSTPDAMAAFLSPPGKDLAGVIARSIRVAKAIGSPGFVFDEEQVRARAEEAFERSFYPVGVGRQMAAAAAHGDRKPLLQKLDVPALVIHGRADPLITVEGGLDTHAALRGSRLLVIDGMGHNLPIEVWPQVILAITQLTAASN